MIPEENKDRFYLGRVFDLAKRTRLSTRIDYPSKDLLTHAVCVGMTGSGKTGLCMALLEEAALDGIPAIIIDPKGDLSNLLLTFPQLRAEDFRPWINQEDARKKGLDSDEFARQQAQKWSEGLREWDQSPERIQKLRDSADFRIYTPGSNAGIGLSILKSFSVPDPVILEDGELLRERVSTTTTSLLGLLEIDADPIQSREHIFISNIIARAWQEGKDLDLAWLIQHIQHPTITRIGVMDLESFYPEKNRFELALKLNNLLASPGFQTWMEGEVLDIASLLYDPKSNKPRHAIISIAHLGDSERMFFVSLLLNQILGWVRTQTGTTNLRAILYMDEIFGYFPPVSNPPSKQPLLTLLKQARAFGLGICLATQNPVDLDYKGLSNCGTWFIGRLQTERDKQRVLEGLEGAAAGAHQVFDRARMEQTLAGLGNRIFLMNNVHRDGPVIFETRWCMSYLRGPMGRNEIKQLMDPYKPRSGTSTQPVASRAQSPSDLIGSGERPILPPQIRQCLVPVRGKKPEQASLHYVPYVLGTADVFFQDRKSGITVERYCAKVAPMTEGPVSVDWDKSSDLSIPEDELEQNPTEIATFCPVPAAAFRVEQYNLWSKQLADSIYRNYSLQLWYCEQTDQFSRWDESEHEFRIRLEPILTRKRDEIAEKIKKRYETRLSNQQEKIRKEQQRLEREKSEAATSRWASVFQVFGSLLQAFLGRRKMTMGNIGRVATTTRSIGRTIKQSSDVTRVEENLESYLQQYATLEQQMEEEIRSAIQDLDASAVELKPYVINPRKTDIKIRLIMLAWMPYWKNPQGQLSPAWE
ncbi:MAG: ATP-binding protein [Phycisphaerae bacterium]|jgi:Skp family chaperone for outer membrane proteins|nr:MAG: ATP-binding protein [Phycisphaerae bacterium]